MPPPVQPTDAAALLAEYGLPENAPQEQLLAITRVAATLCGVPTAVVNLLGECFQHQVGAFGFEGADGELSTSMCARAMAEPALRYLPDAAREPGFATNPWVDGRFARVRLYASVPLELDEGRVLGSLCVFSEEPGELSRAQRDGLVDLGRQAVALFEHARLTRQAQEMARELRASQERYRVFAEASADVVSVHDPQGTTLWISPSVQRVFGYSPEDEIGHTPVGRAHPDDLARSGDTFLRALAGQPGQVLVRSRAADGGYRWMETTLTPTAIIRNFEPILIPGLLQTEEYARAVLSEIEPMQRVDPLVDLRVERQELLVRPKPPSLHFIIDEAAIRRAVGGPEVMRRQLQHVKDLASEPHVHIRVVPFEVGMYPKMRVPYVLIEFDAPEDEDILFVEYPNGDTVIRENPPLPSDVDGPLDFLQAFWRKEQLGHTEDTPAILEDAMSRIARLDNAS